MVKVPNSLRCKGERIKWLCLGSNCPTVADTGWSKCSVVARPAFQGSKGYVALFGVKLANSFRYKEKGLSGFVGGQTSSRYRD